MRRLVKLPALAATSLLSLLCLGSGCGRQHTLVDGQYVFTLDENLRDDCMLANAPGYISKGRLVTTGDVVRFDYELFAIQLFGNYLSDTERMELDGNASNISTRVNQTDCLVDFATMHLETVTRAPNVFTGSGSIKLDARRPPECVCDFWFKFTATRVP